MKKLALLIALIISFITVNAQPRGDSLSTQTDSLSIKHYTFQLDVRDWETVYRDIDANESLSEVAEQIRSKFRAMTSYPSMTTKVRADSITGHQLIATYQMARSDIYRYSENRVGLAIKALNAPYLTRMINYMEAEDARIIQERRIIGRRKMRGRD